MRVLVIKPSSLGDIAHGLQVAAIMKKYIGGIEIDWVVRDCFADIVAASGIASKIHLFHRGAGALAFLKLLRSIGSVRYDAVLDMHGLARSGLMTFAARSKRKIGRHDSRELAFLFYNEKISRGDTTHAIDILLQFLPKFGLLPNFEYALDFSASSDFCNFEDRNILLFPESRKVEKQWPFFPQLTQELANRYENLRFIIVGQRPVDLKISERNVLNLAGKTSLSDMLSLIANCDMLIANDSAPIHIGAALQKRIVALFGPTDFRKYGPYPIKCIRHTILSAPDLTNLSVSEVFDASVLQIDNFLRTR
jgi:ADP-heptose:LPS heptosyltransferase